jgi:hypothetical protein
VPLISIHDAAPVALRGRRNVADRRAWVSAITFVDCLNDALLAHVAADTPEQSTELAERVAWGVWRAGMHYDGQQMIPWDAASYEPPVLWPHPAKSELRPWSRRVVLPPAMLWVYGGPLAWQTPKYLAACADLGLMNGPARWDHRSQYLSQRSLPRDVTVSDALGEIGDAPLSKRMKIRPTAIIKAIAEEAE